EPGSLYSFGKCFPPWLRPPPYPHDPPGNGARGTNPPSPGIGLPQAPRFSFCLDPYYPPEGSDAPARGGPRFPVSFIVSQTQQADCASLALLGREIHGRQEPRTPCLRSRTASNDCSDEAIHLVQIGASAQVATLNKQRCEVRKFLRELVTIQRSESGIPRQNSFNCLLIFLGFERTGRIHQATAIREHRKAVLEHCTLRLL